MPFKTGILRHRITIQRNAVTQDPTTGEMVTGWADLATVWANVRPLSTRDVLAAAASNSEVRGKMMIRWRGDLGEATKLRVLHDGRTYRVIGYREDAGSGREHLTLDVTDGVAVS